MNKNMNKNIHITYYHTSHTGNYKASILSSGSMFQEILTSFIIAMLCNIEVIYHNSWERCKFINYKSFKKHTVTSLEKYDHIENINYRKWESITFKDMVDIKHIITNSKPNTLIVLNNISLINPSFLYKWYTLGYLDKDIYSELFIPTLRNMYFYDNTNNVSDGICIHIRTGDLNKRFWDKGLDLNYYTNIINTINNHCNYKIYIVYEGIGPNTTLELTQIWGPDKHTKFNYLWPRELKKLKNVILKEGNLDNINEQINDLCNAKYSILSPSTFSYYSGMISKGLKFVDHKVIDIRENTLKNTIDLPQFITYNDFSEVVHNII